MHAPLAELGGQAVPHASQRVRWVAVDQLEAFAFPKANRAVLEALTRDQGALP